MRLTWADAPDDYAICLCGVGLALRVTQNAHWPTSYALWQVWAAREAVDPSRIFLLEEVLTPDEVRAHGFEMPARPTLVSAVAAAAHAKTPKGRR